MAAPSWHSPLAISRSRGAVRARAETVRWALACCLTVLPLTALLHHVVFYHGTCMLNSFGADYSGAVTALWLARDPSPWVAMLIALAIFQIGNHVGGVRPLVLPFVLAFLPLSLWIWDLPFTGRVICDYLHDERVLLAEGLPLKSRHLYFVGAAVFGLHLVRRSWRRIPDLLGAPALMPSFSMPSMRKHRRTAA